MRTSSLVSLLSLAWTLASPGGCSRPRPAASAQSVAQPRRPRGPAVVTPHNELVAFGPYGPGVAECTVMLYAWNPAAPGCRYQLNHCSYDALTGQTVCLSLADERSVACGGQGDACGQPVRCACPTGAPPVVQDPPDIVVVSPAADGPRWSSGESCSARVARLAGTGDASDEPCEVSVRECERGTCNDRWVTLSCGERSEVCGHPVRCECGRR